MSAKSSNPKVSIVIPVYNGSNYLKESIECALSQTYPNCEVIVINDGSSDGGKTAEIARSYGERIVYIEKENGGVSSALNLGIQKMTGDYFSWLSHDDVYTPSKVSDSIAALDAAGCLDNNTIAYTGHNQINEDSKVLKVFPDKLSAGRRYTSAEMLHYSVKHKTLNGCCMLIPVDTLKATGGFDENLRYAQDALMWFRLFFSGVGLVFDGKVNVGYRLHSTQTSRVRHDLFDRDMTAIAKEICKSFYVNKEGADNAFIYAKRLSRYGAREACDMMIADAARAGYPYSCIKIMKIKALLFYSRFRSGLKRIYYRWFIKVKV